MTAGKSHRSPHGVRAPPALTAMQVDLSVTPEGISMTQHSPQRAPSQLVNTADFAARDERICCLSYGVMRKLAGLPQDLFAGYWRDVLGPSTHDFPASATTSSIIFHRTTGRIYGLCQMAFAAWMSCSTAPWKSASPTMTAKTATSRRVRCCFADAFHQRIPALAGIRACGTEITLQIDAE